MNWSQIAAKTSGNDNNNNFQAPTTIVASVTPQQQQQNNQQQFQVTRLRATDDQFKILVRGIDSILQQWTALNLVCSKKNQPHNNDGSNNQAQKVEFNQGPANQMRDDLRQWFADDGELFSDEIEDYFYEFFDRERAAWIEDGSLKEVADSLHEMYRRVCANDDSVVLRFEQSLFMYQQSNTLGQCVNFGGGDENDEDDEDEDEDDDDPDAALRGYDDEGNYVGGDDDREYDEEDDDDENGCYVDEDGAISKKRR